MKLMMSYETTETFIQHFKDTDGAHVVVISDWKGDEIDERVTQDCKCNLCQEGN